MVVAGIRLRPRITHHHSFVLAVSLLVEARPVSCLWLLVGSVAWLWLLFLLAVVLLQYLFVVKPVWLCVLMFGEKNVFPRQDIGKPLWLSHTALSRLTILLKRRVLRTEKRLCILYWCGWSTAGAISLEIAHSTLLQAN